MTSEENINSTPVNQDDNLLIKDAIDKISESVKNQKENLDEDFLAFDDENFSKKYIIDIEQNNIAKFEEYTNERRNRIINTLLKEYFNNELILKRKISIKTFLTQIIIIVITFLVGLPVTYFAVNKSFTLTRKNVKEIQSNFEQLYTENNKLKPKEQLTNIKNIYQNK